MSPKKKIAPPVKVRVMLSAGPVDGRIEEVVVTGTPPETIYVPVPPADFSIDPDECHWGTATYQLRSQCDFDLLGVHYLYIFVSTERS